MPLIDPNASVAQIALHHPECAHVFRAHRINADSRLRASRLHMMHDDHLRVGELLTSMCTLAGDYVMPDWACGSYRALMNELRTIEADTMRHVQIENHVLMPRLTSRGGPLSQPAVPAAAHFDGVGTRRTAAGALRGMLSKSLTQPVIHREGQ